MLSKSRFNRRLHQIPDEIWQTLFWIFSQAFQTLNPSQRYVIDSFPVPVCHNIRIRRCKIYQNEAYRGYCAAKKQYFYGLRIHLVATAEGQPVEFLLVAGSTHDCEVLKRFALQLPEGAELYGDAAYTDYEYEELLAEAAQIRLLPMRKQNSKRPFSGCVRYLQQKVRKIVETVGSQLNQLMPHSIHAVTGRCFELKVGLFVIAFAFSLL